VLQGVVQLPFLQVTGGGTRNNLVGAL